MKNYSLNYKESEKFIKGYNINEGKINIKYVSGKVKSFPYTSNKENEILYKMKKQVLNSNDFIINQKVNIFIGLITIISMSFLVPAAITSGYFAMSFVPAAVLLFGVGIIISSKAKLNDVNKNKLFLKNEMLLNSKIKSSENVLNKTNLKKKDITNSESKMTLNTIHKMKLKQLKQILENINRDEYLKNVLVDTNNKQKKLNLK